MPAYVFKGKTRAGAATSGERTADSKDAVISMLRREQILVTSVKEKGKEIALPKFGTGISHKDVAIFVRQFSVMIDAGLPLVQCLEILGSQQDQATRFIANLGDDRWQPELLESFDLVRNGSIDRGDRAPLLEHVGAKPRQVLDAEREVELEGLFETVLLVVGEHAVGELLGFNSRERWHVERPQLTVHADLRR